MLINTVDSCFLPQYPFQVYRGSCSRHWLHARDQTNRRTDSICRNIGGRSHILRNIRYWGRLNKNWACNVKCYVNQFEPLLRHSSFAGKILKKIGYGYCFALCFLNYALRLGLISLATTPHWIVLIEFFMQGPTYALCYTTIVAYASAISPPGASATVQGIVAGMDDGLGPTFFPLFQQKIF